jgi:rhomboid family GlyGly-CTERM serine protease
VSRGTRAWVALAGAFALAALLAWFAPRNALDWQPSRAWHEPWRAWGAAFVHWTPLHLGANLLGCAAVAAFGAAARLPTRASFAWLIAWPLTHIALAAQPALASYGGLSGVLHAGVAIGAWHLVRHDTDRRRAIGVAVAGGLMLKLLLERPWAAPTQTVAGWDFAVAPIAHASGALTGLAAAALLDALARWRSR